MPPGVGGAGWGMGVRTSTLTTLATSTRTRERVWFPSRVRLGWLAGLALHKCAGSSAQAAKFASEIAGLRVLLATPASLCENASRRCSTPPAAPREVPLFQFTDVLFALWLEAYGPVRYDVTFPHHTHGVSLDELFAEADWESDLESLRLYAA